MWEQKSLLLRNLKSTSSLTKLSYNKGLSIGMQGLYLNRKDKKENAQINSMEMFKE